MWKKSINEAYEAAQHAYNRVKTGEEKIECFTIMYTCAVMICNPVSACIKIRTWIEELCQDATIKKAFREFSRCVNGNRLGKKTYMSNTTKELLAKFFKQLKGAVIVLFYLSDNDPNCKVEKGQTVQLLRRTKDLSNATRDIGSLENMKCKNHGLTVVRVIYYFTVVLPLMENMAKIAKKSFESKDEKSRNNQIDDPAKQVIIETGHLLHLICHSAGDLNFSEFAHAVKDFQPPTKMQLWKEQILDTVLKKLEKSTFLKNTMEQLQNKKQQIAHAYHEQKQVVKTIPFSNISSATKIQKVYISLFTSFSLLGLFSLLYSSYKMSRSKNYLFNAPFTTIDVFSRRISGKMLTGAANTQRMVKEAVSVVARDIEDGGGLLVYNN